MRFELLVLGFIAFLISSTRTQEVRMKRQTFYQRQLLLWQHRVDLCEDEIEHLKALNANQIETIHDLFLKLHQLESELNRTKNQLCPSSQELIRTKTELNETKTELIDAKTELNDAKTELIDAKSELNETKTELNETKAEFNETLHQLNRTIAKALISASTNETILVLTRAISELARASNTLIKSEDKLMRTELMKSVEEQYYAKKEPDFTWTITDIRDKVKRTNFTLLSEVFPLKGYSFGAQAKLTRDENTFLSISLAYKDLSENGTALNLNLIPGVRYTYKEGPSRNIMREVNYDFGTVLPYDVFRYNAWVLRTKYIANDTISLDIRVEPPEEVQKGYSYNGSLTWAIDHFRSKREAESKELVWRRVSPNLYTGPKGYRVRARLFLNGYGGHKGKGLTVGVAFLTGPNDADLTRSFKHTTTLTLFHPTDPSKIIVKSVERDLKDGAFYTMDMGTHAEVENILDGDTLYYHVKIIRA